MIYRAWRSVVRSRLQRGAVAEDMRAGMRVIAKANHIRSYASVFTAADGVLA